MDAQRSEHLMNFVPNGIVLPGAHIQRDHSIRGEVIQQGGADILVHDKASLIEGEGNITGIIHISCLGGGIKEVLNTAFSES